MLNLQDAHFLQALGYAVINSIWQVAIVWLVVSLLELLFTSPAARYRLSSVGQLVSLGWFIASLVNYREAGPGLYAQQGNATLQTINTLLYNISSVTTSLLPLLSVAYLLVLFVKLVRWTRLFRHVHYIQQHELLKIPVEWRLFVQDLSEHFSIKRKVRIYLSGLTDTPLTIGYFKPVILIPLASLNNLSIQQMEAVIIHELCHIKRADFLFNFLQSLIEIIFFFNPFILLLGKKINREREHICDDQVLQFRYSPLLYADALLKLALQQHRVALALQATGRESGELLLRINRMLERNNKEQRFSARLLAPLLLACAIPLILWLPKPTALAEVKANMSTGTVAENGATNLYSNIMPLQYLSAKNYNSKKTTSTAASYVKEELSPRHTASVSGNEPGKSAVDQNKAHTDKIKEVAYIPASYSYTYNYDPVISPAPVSYANIAAPELTTEQAYRQSLKDYLKATVLAKQLEDSSIHISVKGYDSNTGSYIKTITIEAVDSTGKIQTTTLSLSVYQ